MIVSLNNTMIRLKECPVCSEPADSKFDKPYTGYYRDVVVGTTTIKTYWLFDATACQRCDLFYVLDRLPPEDLIYFYASGLYATRHPESANKSALDARQEKAQPFIDEVKDALTAYKISPSNQLDFGCGLGNLLRSVDWPGVGVDISPPVVGWARNHGVTVYDDLSEVEEEFDLVTMIEVLEHLDDPVGVLQALNDKMVEGGHILVTVPDLEAGHQSPVSAVHIQAFSPRALKNLLAFGGFELVAMLKGDIPNKTLMAIGRKI